MDGQDEVPALLLPQQHWSVLPPEVLGIILSNLQRKSDLLCSRLVCRAWNEECVRVMKKPESGFYQTLTESNINQYIDFASNGDCVPEVCRIIPFHLDINLYTDTTTTTLNNLTKNIEILCSTYGRECITKITLSTIPMSDWFDPDFIFIKSWLTDFFVNISPSVKILSLRDLSLRICIHRGESKKTDIWAVKFPKLKSLICSGRIFWGQDLTRHYIHRYIIKRSPNIENIEQIRTQDLIDLPINYDKLRTLTIGKTITDPSQILEKFHQASASRPILQNFGFSLNHFVETRQIPMFQNILEFFSSTLKSLTITTTGEYLTVNRIGTRRSGLLTFPSLPNLQHIRLNMDTQVNNYKVEVETTTEDLICYDPEKKNFTAEYFPSLKSVEVPLGFMLSGKSGTTKNLKTEIYPDPPVNFPNVHELTIRMSRTRLSLWISDLGDGNRLESAFKHLQKVFPNVSKLSIIYESSDAVIRYATTYRFSNLCNLTTMAQCFPALQILEISKFLFRGGMTDTQREEQILQPLATTFPYLWVYVIDE